MNNQYTPDFASWCRETLDQFAHDCNAKLREQHHTMQAMQQRIKTLEAENALLRTQLTDDWK